MVKTKWMPLEAETLKEMEDEHLTATLNDFQKSISKTIKDARARLRVQPEES